MADADADKCKSGGVHHNDCCLVSRADCYEGMAPANETIQCILVRAGTKGIQEVESFHPAITHAIFGNDEEIFGFQDLAVNIRFASHDLSSHLDKTFTEAYKGRNTIGAANLDLTLEELLDPSKTSAAKIVQDHLLQSAG